MDISFALLKIITWVSWGKLLYQITPMSHYHNKISVCFLHIINFLRIRDPGPSTLLLSEPRCSALPEGSCVCRRRGGRRDSGVPTLTLCWLTFAHVSFRNWAPPKWGAVLVGPSLAASSGRRGASVQFVSLSTLLEARKVNPSKRESKNTY